MADIREALTRKIGPLPVWAWGGVVGGGILVARALTGDNGASSPFVAPIAQDGTLDFAGGGGGSGGSSGGAGGTGSGTTTPAPTTTATASLWGSDIPATIRNAFSDKTVASRLRALGIDYGSKVNLVDLVAALRKQKIDYGTTVNVVDVKALGVKQTTSTTATTGEIPHSPTPPAMVATVPAMPPLPIGNTLALPTFDTTLAYAGPSIDLDSPIPSSARIDMPPVSGQRVGAILPPLNLPIPNRRGWPRIAAELDRLTPDLPPTTAVPRLPSADAIRTAIETRTRRNASG